MSTVPFSERSKTIKLSTIFEVSLYAMVALSSGMLFVSEGTKNGLPPQTFTIFILIPAYYFVDRAKKGSLPMWVAGILGLVALGWSFGGIPQYLKFEKGMPVLPEEKRLELIFAAAHLLVYLTWIVLLVEKANQQYWWLWALCVLQIAVGASQSTESLYGILLSAYLFLAVWTLSVFSLLQGQQQFDRAQKVAELTHGFDGPSPATDSNPSSNQLGDNNSSYSNPQYSLWRQPSSAVGNVQRDPTDSWINPRFFGGVLGTGSVAFLVALIFFFLIPRHPSIWRQSQFREQGQSTVGFSRNLALGDIGQILESRKKVMSVRLTDSNTGDEMDIEKYAVKMGYGEPLFRGMTTMEYEGGKWQGWQPDDPMSQGQPLPNVRFAHGEYVEQWIELEGVDSMLLFAMPPARYGTIEDSKESIQVEWLSDVLKRPSVSEPDETVTYRILSPKTPDKPGALPVRAINQSYLDQRRRFYTRVPSGLERLRQLAVEKAGFENVPQPSKEEMARRLVDFLQNSGEYSYTLNANVQDPAIDPLEDFLFNRKVGHCEYFASALAMMLRCVGIPTRLVSGFKGGDYNDQSGLFEVEERHAHAWVEAYIDESWVILDPTPASRAESVDSLGANSGAWSNLRFRLQDVWQRFIAQLNVSEQRRLLAPLKELIVAAVDWLKNGRGHFSSFVRGLKHQLQSPERWISWQGGLVTFVLLTALSAVVWLVRVV
ncbi:MAG: DUF3488 domain-containing protein, partial [Planctomycetaceae bacterium]|nr:DUF3488 domain-containing protein [Planctomycetaceae bacterium]